MMYPSDVNNLGEKTINMKIIIHLALMILATACFFFIEGCGKIKETSIESAGFSGISKSEIEK